MANSDVNSLKVVILAAGKGTRMRSSLPKVLHTLGGKPLISYTLSLAADLAARKTVLVLGHRAQLVQSSTQDIDKYEIVIQDPQQGTGHALLQCLDFFTGFTGTVLVLSGDVPMLLPETVNGILESHRQRGAAVTVLTSNLKDPDDYGRIIRDEDTKPVAIREQKDLLHGEDRITEVNMGVYAFDAPFLARELPRLSNDNAQGEYYLTDLVLAASGSGMTVTTHTLKDPDQALGINTLAELANMEVVMQNEILTKLMDSGVRIMDPATTYVDKTVKIEADVVLHPMTFLQGETTIGTGSVIHPGAVISDSILGEDVTVRPYSVINSSILEKGADVGPFAHLRPGTHLKEDSRIGNFVEVKKSTIGRGSKASHLTYIGDSDLGEGVNIGAGTVTCNYDGFSKHNTVIEDGVFIGSGTMLVAPVRIGNNSIVAAGSTITRDVPPEALGIARGKQTVKENWAPEFRQKAAKGKEDT
jgi:bifunctional UDP-N-acetylglucosamine pyrophosphorylase/glucosamine-1-phosphate N-acetyltransferase